MEDDCLFCGIVDGEMPSHTVYETDDVMAFLDVNPLSRGHTLVIPKRHAAGVGDLPDVEGRALFEAVHDIADDVADAVGADGYNLGLNNGEAAGQEIDHVHFHVVPRRHGDGGGPIHAIMPGQQDVTDDALAAVADDVRDAL
jgi:histidine triad (HIT) family protein